MNAELRFPAVRSEQQIERVAELAERIWREFYTPLIGRAQVDYMVERFQSAAAMRAQIASGYEYFLVQRDGRDVGYCAIEVRPAENALFISKFYVDASVRGSGTGRACMEFIEHLARQRGVGLLWLTVNKRNPSVHVYERLGFRIAAELVMDIGEGFVMDDYRMEKALVA